MIAGVLRQDIGREGEVQNSLHHSESTFPSFTESPCSSAVKLGRFVPFLEFESPEKKKTVERKINQKFRIS